MRDQRPFTTDSTSALRQLAVGVTPMENRREVVLRLATLAEDLGYSAFFVAEGWGYDAGVLLTEIALRTHRIRIGTGVLNVWGRSAAGIAMLAASLAEVSEGRFTLGLGAGSPALAEGFHDVPFQAPVRRLGDVTRSVRRLLEGGRALPSDAQQPGSLRLAAPRPAALPIYLAALGPAAVRLAGEVADGWVPFLLPQSGLDAGVRLLEDGAGRASRDRVPVVAPSLPAAVSDTESTAREVAWWWISFYLTRMGPLYGRALRELGLGTQVEAVLAHAGSPAADIPRAAWSLVDELVLAGDEASARDRLDAWYAAGAQAPAVVLPPGRGLAELEAMLHALRPIAVATSSRVG
jgi:alkanesulfonate monooxygenase SsuD/methylene tetrahydromethanopterin reductase-like flavin-dependent oxidoreductase (luciferase family)